MGFICVFFHDVVMKRSNMSLIKDEISMFLSLLALQATYPKVYKNIATNSFEIVVSLSMWRVIFFLKIQKWMAHGLFIFNAYPDLMFAIWDFPNIKVWLSLPGAWPIFLDIEKTKIQKLQRIPHVLVWLKVIIKEPSNTKTILIV